MVSSANIKLKQRSAKSERLAGAHYDESLRICIECVSDIRILKNGERHITVSYELEASMPIDGNSSPYGIIS